MHTRSGTEGLAARTAYEPARSSQKRSTPSRLSRYRADSDLRALVAPSACPSHSTWPHQSSARRLRGPGILTVSRDEAGVIPGTPVFWADGRYLPWRHTDAA